MLDFLKQYAHSDTARFHMPGHKGKGLLRKVSRFVPKIDITEIKGSDNLHDATGIIMESQKRAAKVFGALETIYSVNGSTAGIYAAITGSLKPGEAMMLQRNSHISAYNALVIGDIKPVFLYPVYSEKLNLPLGVTPRQVKESFRENPNIKAVFLTSPSYYGICLDLEKIATIVHENGALLIVDEAHGAHLSFSESFPKSALSSGADIVIQSTHKTLLSFTQTSMIHVNSKRVDIEKVKKMAKMYQSTSPSYILMASLDFTVKYLEKNSKEEFKKYVKRVKKCRERIESLNGVRLIGAKDLKCGFQYDFSKIVFKVKGYSGKEVESLLRAEDVELEMSDLFYGVALSSFSDTKSDFKRLEKSLRKIKRSNLKKKDAIKIKQFMPNEIMEARSAFYSKSEKVSLKDSLHRVAAEMVIPYPPGIPILIPGEKIDLEILNYINRLLDDNHSVQGIRNGKIETIREE